MDNSEFLIGAVPVALVIVGLVQVYKHYFGSKYAPLVAIIIGLALGVIYAMAKNEEVLDYGILGLYTGILSSGIYSGTKAVSEDFTGDNIKKVSDEEDNSDQVE
ncbi:hypothetical protein COY23_02275 [bacterium (Candidatus Torokbacteria) CG_4_10_14_0_2_um_filter_35_8]|nr:MAG: hypothetical protein COY23_02275 [bacterium (Candidatus Torokbacteria) CG_4_10_14_0_2_um_filter_35_8]